MFPRPIRSYPWVFSPWRSPMLSWPLRQLDWTCSAPDFLYVVCCLLIWADEIPLAVIFHVLPSLAAWPRLWVGSFSQWYSKWWICRWLQIMYLSPRLRSFAIYGLLGIDHRCFWCRNWRCASSERIDQGGLGRKCHRSWWIFCLIICFLYSCSCIQLSLLGVPPYLLFATCSMRFEETYLPQ